MRDVRAACADWAKMQHALRRTADDLESLGARLDPRDLSETRALLQWMEDRHFTFLGYREYRLRGGKVRENLQRVEATGLGILRRGPGHVRLERGGRHPGEQQASPKQHRPAPPGRCSDHRDGRASR